VCATVIDTECKESPVEEPPVGIFSGGSGGGDRGIVFAVVNGMLETKDPIIAAPLLPDKPPREELSGTIPSTPAIGALNDIYPCWPDCGLFLAPCTSHHILSCHSIRSIFLSDLLTARAKAFTLEIVSLYIYL
jgi:hypothetical protein